MAFRKFRADYIFDGYRLLGQEHALVTDDSGKVEEVVLAEQAGEDTAQLKGLIMPGFINAHCHLELSHLKNVIPPHTGLIEFLCSVVTKRGFDPQVIQQEIRKAEKEMYDNGIVAVGDIGNSADTVETKSKSKICWQNFVEVLSFTDHRAEENILHYQSVASTLEDSLRNTGVRSRTSLVPHAPYSISPKSFSLINNLTSEKIISIHNQEHPAEDELYRTGGGDYLKLFRIFGLDQSPFPITGLSSVRSCLPHFDKGQTIFLVHNTFMPEADVQWANEFASTAGLKLVYCFCVNANLYIENKLPPLEQFIHNNCLMVLGTDSYSSNWQLNIWSEIQSIRKHFPGLPLETVLKWATSNGARALNWSDSLGSFEKGKIPGVVWVEDFDPGLAGSGNAVKRIL